MTTGTVDTVKEITAVSDLIDVITDKIQHVLPGASNITAQPSAQPFAVIGFELEGCKHMFRLRRDAGLWYVREWICDGRSESLADKTLSSPNFERLLASILGYDEKQPRIRIQDMRCPEDPRRLFGKVIIQEPLPPIKAQNLLEFSCSQCKRRTGTITMHLFDIRGELVKSESLEHWVRRESGKPWYSMSEMEKSASRAAVPSENGSQQRGG